MPDLGHRKLVQATDKLDGAILDLNLCGEGVFPVVDVLCA
jgi:hypothetical protein